MNPDVGALGGVDVAQWLQVVVELQQPVFRLALGSVGAGGPVLGLARLDPGDLRRLGAGQDAAPQIIDEVGVEASGQGCLGCLHDTGLPSLGCGVHGAAILFSTSQMTALCPVRVQRLEDTAHFLRSHLCILGIPVVVLGLAQVLCYRITIHRPLMLCEPKGDARGI